MVFVRFLKNTFNFTRSCAFAQKAKFYALKMLKKQIITHPKAAKLATLHVLKIMKTKLETNNIPHCTIYLFIFYLHNIYSALYTQLNML